ncbi:MAG: DEAD/DEAH box helicase [Pseudomonadaceae bacterium]|nr:DEAD/DEAH box helicase [Pseudomonadaceae bacterium]
MTSFHPSISRWFAERFDAPTPVQAAAWPVIGAGKHALVTAPTGSGKTLTAFLWALSRFASGEYERGATRVLYVSPMKALNTDIARNLNEPLRDLQARFDYPDISVKTRSGDTSQGDRQRMLRRPPDILITTPESLNLLLTTTRGRQALSTVEAVVLDEIHALVEDRRGVMLLTALERLVDEAGEFQRIALSATVNPLEAVAGYVAGYDRHGNQRDMQIVNAPIRKVIDFSVRFPASAKIAAEQGNAIWDPLADSFRDVIEGNRSTLFFANSRQLTEKLTLKINGESTAPIAYAHHGSLARELRAEVERRLKAGELSAIVATNSLELGIDVGDLDEVVLVQSPPTIASTLQRIGRAGHQVGAVSRGSLYPTHARDFLDAAVLAQAVSDRDLEPLELLNAPLDVLAQILISCTASEERDLDELFALLRRSGPYRHLDRARFDLVVDMLAGRYAGDRIRSLKQRLSVDRMRNKARALKGAVLAMYAGGGSIPDRGYYQLRHADSGARIGELDEEFVWEAKIGQTFTLGTQIWQVRRITNSDVLVSQAKSAPTLPPFWRAESRNRSFHFSSRIGDFLERCEHLLAERKTDELRDLLENLHGFERSAADELIDYLSRQRDHTGVALPHRRHLIAEWVRSGPGGYTSELRQQQLILHTFWGGTVNRPFAYALDTAWQQAFGERAEIHADNDAIAIQTKLTPDLHDVLSLVTPDNLQALLRESLEGTGFFGARFRECAGRSLLLTKKRFDARMPLWMTRIQAKQLLTDCQQYSDFPLLIETWRTCLNDEFNLPALNAELERLATNELSVTLVNSSTPSPFAANLTFSQINRYMYADDSPDDLVRSALADHMIDGAVTGSLTGLLSEDVVAEFEAKRQRRLPGYQPQSDEDWVDWVRERVLLPEAEAASAPDHDDLVWVTVGDRRWLCHAELLEALIASEMISSDHITRLVPASSVEHRTDLAWAREFMTFYGPRSEAEIKALLPNVPRTLFSELASGPLLRGRDDHLYCDQDNYEQLLRFQRIANRPQATTQPVTAWARFIAQWQNVAIVSNKPRAHAADHNQAAAERLDALRGLRAPVRTWLEDLLPARGITDPGALNNLITDYQWMWVGLGRERVTFLFPEEIDLILAPESGSLSASNKTGEPEELDSIATNPVADLFADPGARYPFNELQDRSDLPAVEFNERFWQLVWQGRLCADTTRPLQQGLERRFATQEPESTRTSRRRAYARATGYSGNWQLIDPGSSVVDDPLEALELGKNRARLLIDRYGVVTRELADREGGNLRWAAVFRALRIMELSGEVLAGLFFDGFSGPQFATPKAIAQLSEDRPLEPYWLSALDPAAPTGLGGLSACSSAGDCTGLLPDRRAANFLGFCRNGLGLIVGNNGARLTFLEPWDSEAIDELMPVLRHLIQRHRRVTIETINEQPARTSPYLEVLQRHVEVVRDHKHCWLQ